jgi:hypothetical protein
MAGSSPLSLSSLPGGSLTSPMPPPSNEMEMFSRPWYKTSIGARSEAAELPPLTIPIQHNTSSSYLLCLPEMKALIGEYPIDLFFLLESRNQLPTELAFNGWLTPLPPVQSDKEVTDYLVSAFFSGPFLCHPILDHDTFQGIYLRFLDVGVDSSIESALCLVVFALGSASLSPMGSHNPTTPPGMELCNRQCQFCCLYHRGQSPGIFSYLRHWYLPVYILPTSCDRCRVGDLFTLLRRFSSLNYLGESLIVSSAGTQV